MRPARFGVLVAGLAASVLGLSALPAQATTGHPATQRPAASTAAPSGSTFTPVTPQRLLDTRTYGQQIAARSGIGLAMPDTVPADATAVVLDLAGTGSTAATYLSIAPEGASPLATSNLNLAAGETRANLVTVAVDSVSHGVMVSAGSAAVDAIVDLEGYYAPGTGGGFTPIEPTRMLDTREGAPVGANGTYTLDLSGKVPAGASSAVFNLTGLDATTSTVVTAYPDGTSLPVASNLNLVPGAITPNLVTVAISADRKVDLHNAFGSVDLVADLAGYYAPGSGQSFYSLSPIRALDTRDDSGNPFQPIENHSSSALDLGHWLPSTATAAVFNLTGTDVTAGTVVTAYPSGSDLPLASNLNLVPGQTSANLVMVALPQNEPNVSLYNLNGQVDAIVDVAGYFAPAIAPCTSGCVSSFGANSHGQFGIGTTSPSVQTATRAYGLSGVSAVDSTGGDTYALRSDGTVWSAGWNNAGELGDGTTFTMGYNDSIAYDFSPVPVRVSGLSDVVAISGSMALKSDGTVWTWGPNYMWNLGSGSQDQNHIATTPVQVSGLTGVVAIAGNLSDRYALKQDGTVWSWGENIDGELGDGTNGGRDNCVGDEGVSPTEKNCASAVPIQVLGLTGVTKIGVQVAAKSDGTVWRWGLHGTQLDDSPTLFAGLTNVTAFAANDDEAYYALLADGTVRAWGQSDNGQLGNNTKCQSPGTGTCYVDAPVQVSGLSSVTAISGGDLAGYALKSDGTVWAWGGGNGGGPLGDGNQFGESLVPVQVPNLAGVTSLGGYGVTVSN